MIRMKREPVWIMITIDDNVCENHKANVSAIDVTNCEVEPCIAINITRGKEAEVMCESTW